MPTSGPGLGSLVSGVFIVGVGLLVVVASTLALRRGPQGFILRDLSVSCGCSGPGLGSLASEVFTVGVGL